MQTVMVFGAGMMGHAIANLLGPEYEFLGFIDNFKEGVMRPEEAVKKNPDCIVLGTVDSERPLEMWAQLMGLGYKGNIIRPNALNIFEPRMAVMRLLAESSPEGAVAELGVYMGNFAYAISKAFPGRELHLFDTFEGFDKRDLKDDEDSDDFTDTSAEAVQARIPEAIIHKGWFPETFAGCEDIEFAFVSIDPDLYAPTKAGLECFWPRLVPGGSIMVHDYHSSQYPEVKKAVDEYCKANNICIVPVADLHGSVVLKKSL